MHQPANPVITRRSVNNQQRNTSLINHLLIRQHANASALIQNAYLPSFGTESYTMRISHANTSHIPSHSIHNQFRLNNSIILIRSQFRWHVSCFKHRLPHINLNLPIFLNLRNNQTSTSMHSKTLSLPMKILQLGNKPGKTPHPIATHLRLAPIGIKYPHCIISSINPRQSKNHPICPNPKIPIT
ncbi:hypothetical protein NC653_016241 [Populus alba x Populus x berolinensis]|uniref:Uncharacterized protein n=1 Tax=Populus alba x Populus x berolinensis TaxID=444605 RepID=A0AAD6QME9_9ROSI|nr:hypothetical protein NC653_016241 [Populus alba x Populus x berolinensis]